MQSIKNTAVTIILLFLSYGVYQVITQPLPATSKAHGTDMLEITEPSLEQQPSANDQSDFLTSIQRSSGEQAFGSDHSESPPTHSDTIPPELLKLDDSEPVTFDDDPVSFSPSRPVQHDQLENRQFPTNNLEAPPPQTRFPVTQASSPEDVRSESESTQVVDFQQAPRDTTTDGMASSLQQFDSDTRIIPQTLTEEVARRPGSQASSADSANDSSATLQESWPAIQKLVQDLEFQEALLQLSRFYRTGNFQPEEESILLDWLDKLAAKVVYSSEHHLRSMPYIIQPGDTIGSLARKWQVPAQLIYNVNARQIPDPNQLTHGVEIKLIQGPFDAEIDSTQGLMTLYLDELYAGRFVVQPGQSVTPGDYHIVDKSVRDQSEHPFWMSLNNGTAIFGTSQQLEQQNAIGLNLKEAEEVFSILSAASTIRVLR